MGRIKEKKIIITFYTTTDAMAMEDWCKEHGVGGRIIPVPPTIMAGCGLAWCIEPEMEEEMIQAIRKSQISYQAMQEAMI